MDAILKFFSKNEYEDLGRILERDIAKLGSGEEIEPPWIVFPNSSPIFGWKQGYEEKWKIMAWLPFWEKLSAEEKEEYLEKWEADADWKETLANYWG